LIFLLLLQSAPHTENFPPNDIVGCYGSDCEGQKARTYQKHK
jgi:hypothetical protein